MVENKLVLGKKIEILDKSKIKGNAEA